MKVKTRLCPVCKKNPLGRRKDGFPREYCSHACQHKGHSKVIGAALMKHRFCRSWLDG